MAAPLRDNGINGAYMDLAYPARLAREPDGRYTVTFPDLPDAITQGDDRDDAIAMAADCLAETVGARMAERADIPAPSRPKRGQVRVAVPVYVAVKAALYVAMRQEGVSLSEMARTPRRTTGSGAPASRSGSSVEHEAHRPGALCHRSERARVA